MFGEYVSTSLFEGLYTCWQRRSLPPVKCSTIQKHITRYKMWNGTCKQRIWPKWPYVTIAPSYTSGECTTKVSSGRYAWNVSWKLSEVISFPTWLCGWIAHGSDIAILLMSNHVHPVKCWILWSVSASLLLFISLRDVVYENMFVHAWCIFWPLSIGLYLSLLSDYKLVHWRSVRVLRSCYQDHGHVETMPAQKVNPFPAQTWIRSQFLMTQWWAIISELTRLCLRPLSHRGWQVHWWSGNLVNPSYSPITKSIRTQMAVILVRHGQ